MKLTPEKLKKIIQEELFYREFYREGTVEEQAKLSESCSACAQKKPCPCNTHNELGDFSDLDDTNISSGEAFAAGEIVGEEKPESIEDSWEFMRFAGAHPHGCHACGEIHAHDVPDMNSYAMVGDRMVIRPQEALSLIEPVMEATGASCPASAAQALADILMLLTGCAE